MNTHRGSSNHIQERNIGHGVDHVFAGRDSDRVTVTEFQPACSTLPVRRDKSHPTERVLASRTDILNAISVPSILPSGDEAIPLLTRVGRALLVARKEVWPAVFVQIPWYAWLALAIFVGAHAGSTERSAVEKRKVGL